MASDVIFDNARGFIDLDSNIFMNDGVMDPKELYLTDLACSKDASSSDSGISTLDDLPDIGNDTDLQSLIDSDFKDLDFGFEHNLTKGERWGCESDFVIGLESIKAEPMSPQTLSVSELRSDDIHFADTLSPDFYSTLGDEISLSHDATSVFLPVKSESPGVQSVCFQELSDQQLHQSPIYSPHSAEEFSQIHSSPPSPLYSIGSPTLPAPAVVTLQPQVTVAASPTSFNFTVLPSTSQPSILVLPQVKREVLTVTPSPPTQPTISAIPMTKPVAAIDLNAILSSNVKIKPKPGFESVVSIANSSNWHPAAVSQVPLSSHQTISVGSLVTTSPLVSPNTITALADAKGFKRAQRIIKNRESASLSRKRKKEYMSSLEERLQACFDENSRLFQENEALKKQVDRLTNENLQLQSPAGVSPTKKMCLMCLVLLLVLNLSPFSLMSANTGSLNSGAFNSLPLHHTGRQLLSVPSPEDGAVRGGRPRPPSSSLFDRGSSPWLEEDISLLMDKMNISTKIAKMCPMYFNSTESLRLAEQLTGWMIRQEEEKKKKEEKKRQKKKKNYPTLRRFGSSAHMQARADSPQSGRYLNSLVGPNYPLQVFNGPDPRQQMLNAIHRRNDTFYILSFSTDYFLVPASAHNKTMRPRMSLLMPVFTPSINESTGQTQDSVAMMQIDCEISNTNLIHIQRSALPKDATLNSTSQDQNFQGYNQNHDSSRSSNGNNSDAASRTDGRLRRDGKYWENFRRNKSFT